MAMWRGGVRPYNGVFVSASHDFVLLYSCPALHNGENFFTSSSPIGAPRNLAPPCKTLFFINLPYNLYYFFNKTYSINKNILEITINFIPSNQINFLKKLNNISKCLTRQLKKKKTHSITHNKINVENHNS